MFCMQDGRSLVQEWTACLQDGRSLKQKRTPCMHGVLFDICYLFNGHRLRCPLNCFRSIHKR